MKNKFEKVYLVNSAQSQFSRPPAGLAFMAGVCEHENIDYQLLDLNIEFLKFAGQAVWNQVYAHASYDLDQIDPGLEQLLDQFLTEQVLKIKNYGADCVALHVLTYLQQQWAVRFLKKLKEIFPVMVIAGGPAVSGSQYLKEDKSQSFGRYLSQENLINYYVCGEGDEIFKNFLTGSRQALGLNTATGEETWQPQLDNLDDLPMPSYRKISINDYYSPQDTPVLSVTSSRGCVRRCTFCDVGHIWKKYRYRNGENMAKEILKHYQDTGATSFWFTDSLINGSLKQFRTMQQKIMEYQQQYPDLLKLRYSGQFIIRPKGSHPEEMYAAMKATGCTHIEVGIESGSEAVRNHIGKKFSNADIDYHFEMSEKYGIQNLMLMMAGYPTETEQDFQDTVNMLKRYQKYVINDTAFGVIINSPASILPNTPLHRMEKELGIHYTGNINKMQQWVVDSNPGLTLRERHRRWIKLIKLSLDLGYNLPAEIMVNTEVNINSWQDYSKSQEHNSEMLFTAPIKKTIPIQSEFSIYS